MMQTCHEVTINEAGVYAEQTLSDWYGINSDELTNVELAQLQQLIGIVLQTRRDI